MADNKDLIDDSVDDDKDFNEGFDNPTAPTPPAPKPEGDEADPEKKVDAEKKEDDEPKDPPDSKDPPPPEPKYVQITEEQLASLTAAAAKVGTFEAKLDKAFGSIGGIQQLVNDLKAKTPEGAAVTVPTDLFDAEFETEFPDIAKGMRAALEKTLKGARGTGDTATVDPEKVTKLVADGIKQREMETLEDAYPDWKEIVGAVESADKADPNNAFRKWLGTQPVDYQTKINSTHSASVLARAIDKFTEATKTPQPKNDPPPKQPAPKEAARRSRIEGAIQPKGDGHVPPPKPTADDEFQAGFESG